MWTAGRPCPALAVKPRVNAVQRRAKAAREGLAMERRLACRAGSATGSGIGRGDSDETLSQVLAPVQARNRVRRLFEV
jgi:hypothetical protein